MTTLWTRRLYLWPTKTALDRKKSMFACDLFGIEMVWNSLFSIDFDLWNWVVIFLLVQRVHQSPVWSGPRTWSKAFLEANPRKANERQWRKEINLSHTYHLCSTYIKDITTKFEPKYWYFIIKYNHLTAKVAIKNIYKIGKKWKK